MKQMIDDESINTDECVVASTYINAQRPYLNKKLSVANAMLNRFFNPQYQKQPHNRIVFYCFHESVFNNLHSHIYLKLPEHLSAFVVIKKFQEVFQRLDDQIVLQEPIMLKNKSIKMLKDMLIEMGKCYHALLKML